MTRDGILIELNIFEFITWIIGAIGFTALITVIILK